jgi:hypothetical protein
MDTIWQDQSIFPGADSFGPVVGLNDNFPVFHINKFRVPVHMGDKKEVFVMKTFQIILSYGVVGLINHKITPLQKDNF